MFYFYHHYFRIQYNFYSKNYLRLLAYNNFSSSFFSKRFLISPSIISLIALFSFSSPKTFQTSVSIMSLIALFSFSGIKRFLMSLIVVSVVSYFRFCYSKRLLRSLHVTSLHFLHVSLFRHWVFHNICCEKKLNIFKKNNIFLYFLKSVLKFWRF